jgi:hypothetical protein
MSDLKHRVDGCSTSRNCGDAHGGRKAETLKWRTDSLNSSDRAMDCFPILTLMSALKDYLAWSGRS